MTMYFGESGPLDETLKQYRVPEHMHEGLIAYVVEGRMPGRFLESVISNDLRYACLLADGENRLALSRIVFWLNDEAPYQCWGSPEKFANWMRKKHEARQSEKAVDAGMIMLPKSWLPHSDPRCVCSDCNSKRRQHGEDFQSRD